VWWGVLGPLLAVDDTGAEIPLPAGRVRVLLAALLTRANHAVSIDELVEILWDGAPPPRAARTVQVYAVRLRHALGPAAAARIVTRTPGYLCRATEDELDLLLFEKLSRLGRAAAHDQAWSRSAALLAEALGLWRGEPLADVPSDVLRERELPHLEQLHLQAVEEHVDAKMHLEQHEHLIPQLRDLTARYPLREHLHAQLMRALARAGRRAEALDAYQNARGTLVEQLGIEPGSELRDLQQRILAGDDEPAVPPAAETAPPQAPASVAPPRQLPAAVRHFTGRARELKVLSELLEQTAQPGGTVVISAIGGMAGIGKTALAVYWAQRHADRFPDGQLYVNLRGFDPSGEPMEAATAVRRFLDALALPPGRIPENLDAQFDLYRSVLADKRVLVVLDNARDAEHVRPLLPGAAGCLVLVTSRNQLGGLVAVEGAVPLALGLLSVGEAHDLLARRLGAERVGREESAMRELIGWCARLPLALNIAAARAALRPERPLSALVDDLRDARRRLDTLAIGDSAADVRAVFSWSYSALSPDAARMFRLLGLHTGPDLGVPAAASLAAVDRDRARLLLGELTAAYLLAELTPGRYSLHDLLRAYAADQTLARDTADDRHLALHRILDHYLRTAGAADSLVDPARDLITFAPARPGVVPETLGDLGAAWQWYDTEHAALLASVRAAADAGFHTHAWQIPWALANLAFRKGHWHDLIDTNLTALTAARHLGDQAACAFAHRVLGRAYTRLGDYPQARRQLRQALELFQEIGDQVGQAHSHRGLAWLLEREGRVDEALDCARRALDLCRAADHRSGQAYALNTIGWLHTRQGDHEQALAACAEALELHREVGDRDGEATTLESLGHTHEHLGHHAEAVACYQRALPLLREHGSRYFEADTLTHLGDTHRAAGDDAAARAAWQQALAILDDLRHPDADAVRAKLRDAGETSGQP